jgi:hypothetical protein
MSSTRKDLDQSIVNACNELIELKTKSAKQWAQQDQERRNTTRKLEESRLQFGQALKPKSFPRELHQQVLIEVFPQEEESFSPFLLSRLSQLCYHIHLMTRAEEFVKTIHQDNLVIVNWLHEVWESMEQESTEMKVQIKQANNELETVKAKCKQETTMTTTASTEDETATNNAEEDAHSVGEETIEFQSSAIFSDETQEKEEDGKSDVQRPQCEKDSNSFAEEENK